jgi:SAM-dependent methyltransferase
MGIISKVGHALARVKALRHPLNCPICGYHGKFRRFGGRPNAMCPRCRSLERHRLLKIWFDRNSARLHGGVALHFAPEASVKAFLKSEAAKYITADVMEDRADKVLNIENMSSEPDKSYDWIVCSHVLEHVDDKRALPELHRILKPNGLLIIMVPIVEGWHTTYEDASVVSMEDRERFFGQYDHVRYYGADVRQRIVDAGFTLEEFTAIEPLVSAHGLSRGEKVFLATPSH